MAPAIKTLGIALGYESVGAGYPIIFITGLGGYGAYWNFQVAALSQHYRTITFDHRGVGSSPGDPPYSVEQWAGDTIHLIDHLKLDRVHLVGHSTGGLIAQTIASTNPDRVTSLILSGTWVRPDDRFIRLFKFRKRVLLEMGEEAYQELGRTLAMSSEASPSPARLPTKDATPPAIVTARIDALLAYDAGTALRRISCPTLVLATKDDLLVPTHLGAVLAAEIPGARLVCLEHGGHHFPRTRSAEYNGLLDQFLGRQNIGREP